MTIKKAAVSFHDDDHGQRILSTAPIRSGEILLKERATVFHQSLAARQMANIDSCSSCGRSLVTSVAAELQRVQQLFPSLTETVLQPFADSLPLRAMLERSYRQLHPLACMAVPTDPDGSADGRRAFVKYCSKSCHDQGMQGPQGHRFLQNPHDDVTASNRLASQRRCSTCPTAAAAEGGESAPVSFVTREHILNPTAMLLDDACSVHCSLRRLHTMATTWNERIWLVTLTLCHLLHQWITKPISTTGTGTPQSFEECVKSFEDSYADVPRLLTAEQRALARAAHRETVRWLQLLFSPQDSDGDDTNKNHTQGLLSFQTYVQLQWVLDANVHQYVLLSPLYELWMHYASLEQLRRRPATLCGSSDRNGGIKDPDDSTPVHPPSSPAAVTQEKEGHDGEKEDSVNQVDHNGLREETAACRALHQLLQSADPELLHDTGCALYRTATKFNHSCSPNVKFFPTLAPVRAVVSALEDVPEAGTELRTSYVDSEKFREQWELRRRRLWDHYGFLCDCRLCQEQRPVDWDDAVIVASS